MREVRRASRLAQNYIRHPLLTGSVRFYISLQQCGNAGWGLATDFLEGEISEARAQAEDLCRTVSPCTSHWSFNAGEFRGRIS